MLKKRLFVPLVILLLLSISLLNVSTGTAFAATRSARTPTSSLRETHPHAFNSSCIQVYQNNTLITPGGSMRSDYNGNLITGIHWSCEGFGSVTVTVYWDWHTWNGDYGPYWQYTCVLNCASGWINPNLNVTYSNPAQTWHAFHVILNTNDDENDYSVYYPLLSSPTIYGDTTCSPQQTAGSTRFCVGPQVTGYCTGAINNATDAYGIPIQHTGTNGNSTCVKVQYAITPNYDKFYFCRFYFYVPYGDAGATIQATLSDGETETLNEDPVYGWQLWFTSGSVISSITFTDGNGQPVNAYQMGWGRYAAQSIEEICQNQ